MIDFNAYFDRFNGKKVLVVGDVMVDTYVLGKVNRVSPEAPVPIVSLEKTDERLGGAANVALNIVALGAHPIICSVVGNDDAGKSLVKLLHDSNVSYQGVVFSDSRKTTVKTRVIGNNQHLLRIDAEQTDDINQNEAEQLLERIEELLKIGIHAIIFEDYNKGVLTSGVIDRIIKMASQFNVITAVDPKKDNFLAYKNVTLFKPNLKELKEGLRRDFNFSADRKAFEEAISELELELKNQISFVTLSEHGVFIKRNDKKHYVPAHLRNIADVSGAGETVISVATLCLIAGFDIKELAEISNIAGGLVCEESGVVSISKEKLMVEVLQILNG
jgi:rfaE bifunctional protein kinase chain/domain